MTTDSRIPEQQGRATTNTTAGLAESRLPSALAQCERLFVRAVFLGERIDLRGVAAHEMLGKQPPVLSFGHDCVAVVFRYGAVVLFHTRRNGNEDGVLRDVLAWVSQPFAEPETEEIPLRVCPAHEMDIDEETIILPNLTVERLQIVAAVLSRSVVLAEYESRVAENFDRIEPFAVELQQRGRGGRRMKNLLQQIGSVLLTEHTMVARVEVREKPELLWEHPELEPLFMRLEDQFEIRERFAALDHKLMLTSRTVSTVLELLQHRRSLRVEWYIVILIVFEILLTLYEMFLRST